MLFIRISVANLNFREKCYQDITKLRVFLAPILSKALSVCSFQNFQTVSKHFGRVHKFLACQKNLMWCHGKGRKRIGRTKIGKLNTVNDFELNKKFRTHLISFDRVQKSWMEQMNRTSNFIKLCDFYPSLGQIGTMCDFLPDVRGNFIWCQIVRNIKMAQRRVRIILLHKALDKTNTTNVLNSIISWWHFLLKGLKHKSQRLRGKRMVNHLISKEFWRFFLKSPWINEFSKNYDWRSSRNQEVKILVELHSRTDYLLLQFFQSDVFWFCLKLCYKIFRLKNFKQISAKNILIS